MEKKKEDNKPIYIGMFAAAVLGFVLGSKHGYGKFQKELIRDWRQVNFGDKVDIHLYYPKYFENEITAFFSNIANDLVELKQLKGGENK